MNFFTVSAVAGYPAGVWIILLSSFTYVDCHRAGSVRKLDLALLRRANRRRRSSIAVTVQR